MLKSEGDVHVSTVVLYGLALGRSWNFHLVPNGCTKTIGNRWGESREARIEGIGRAASGTANSMIIDIDQRRSLIANVATSIST
jgi:hypothetical protein